MHLVTVPRPASGRRVRKALISAAHCVIPCVLLSLDPVIPFPSRQPVHVLQASVATLLRSAVWPPVKHAPSENRTYKCQHASTGILLEAAGQGSPSQQGLALAINGYPP